MAVRIWRFGVQKKNIEDFLNFNEKDWPTLFQKAKGYQGTTVEQSLEQPGVFLTLDNWNSIGDFNSFMMNFESLYDKVDRMHAKFYTSAEYIGFFDLKLSKP